MRSRVVFVGRGVPRDGAIDRWDALSLRDFLAGRTRAMSPIVVVLGDNALQGTDPAAVARIARGTRTVFVAAPERAPVEVVAFWARAGGMEFVSPTRLADRLRELESRPLRVVVEPIEWLGAPLRSPRARALADALTRIDAPRVAAWATEVGMSRFQLNRATRQCFGRCAGSVCRAYRDACVASGRQGGDSTGSLAESLGYAEASSLRRAVRAAQRAARERPAGQLDAMRRVGSRVRS